MTSDLSIILYREDWNLPLRKMVQSHVILFLIPQGPVLTNLNSNRLNNKQNPIRCPVASAQQHRTFLQKMYERVRPRLVQA